MAPPEASAKLSWNAVKNGVTYRVAMDYNVTQANLLLSAALDEPGIASTSHDIKGLNVGRYFWRVSAVNKDGLEGAFSRVSFFAVVEPETPQPAPDAGRGAPGPGAPGARRGRPRQSFTSAAGPTPAPRSRWTVPR